MKMNLSRTRYSKFRARTAYTYMLYCSYYLDIRTWPRYFGDGSAHHMNFLLF